MLEAADRDDAHAVFSTVGVIADACPIYRTRRLQCIE